MDKTNSITNTAERKRGEHLKAEERGAIQQLKKLGYSNRRIAKELNCCPATIGNELKRGTPEYCGRGRKPGYSAKHGGKVYKQNRKACHRKKRILRDSAFLKWLVEQFRNHKWSLDACVGYAKLHRLFPDTDIPCTKTLYNMIWRGDLELSVFELPEALQRRKRGKPRVTTNQRGKSIDERPAEVYDRSEFGHWESDTVIGKKKKGEPVIFSIVERKTGNYLTIRTSGRTTSGIKEAMDFLVDTYGEKFPQVFKTITTDNGPEFAEFSTFEGLGTKIYFAHPYSSWERPINERENRVLRRFIPKGTSIGNYSDEEILEISVEINATPRKSLGYRTAEDLFDEELDRIYTR